jgi:hypothetical protein
MQKASKTTVQKASPLSGLGSAVYPRTCIGLTNWHTTVSVHQMDPSGLYYYSNLKLLSRLLFLVNQFCLSCSFQGFCQSQKLLES